MSPISFNFICNDCVWEYFPFTWILGVNLALNKPAMQSTDYRCCEQEWFYANNAVDGNLSSHMFEGTCTHTDVESEVPPWWQVDLGAQYAVKRIVITNRADCCGELTIWFLEVCTLNMNKKVKNEANVVFQLTDWETSMLELEMSHVGRIVKQKSSLHVDMWNLFLFIQPMQPYTAVYRADMWLCGWLGLECWASVKWKCMEVRRPGKTVLADHQDVVSKLVLILKCLIEIWKIFSLLICQFELVASPKPPPLF